MKAVLMGVLGINHQSPLIYWVAAVPVIVCAGNQSPIPFDILQLLLGRQVTRWESITNPL